MSFLSHKTYIHTNGFALGLGLKRRLRKTRKCAIKKPGKQLETINPLVNKTNNKFGGDSVVTLPKDRSLVQRECIFYSTFLVGSVVFRTKFPLIWKHYIPCVPLGLSWHPTELCTNGILRSNEKNVANFSKSSLIKL